MARIRGVSHLSIDADQLERMARIARSLPGRLVSVRQRGGGRHTPRSGHQSQASLVPGASPAVPPPLLRIDGVAAAEILARYEHAGLV